jgi:putative transposase
VVGIGILIRDRDSRYGEAFDRRLRGLGVRQLRTPLKAPRANALAERWVRSARTECLDHLFIVDERHLQRVLDEYVAYFKAQVPMGDYGEPEDLAPLAVYLASDASRYMTGAVLVIDGGYTLW